MNDLKIWTKTELGKGYMVSDKVTFKGKKFELMGLKYIIGKELALEFNKEYQRVKYNKDDRRLIIMELKKSIKNSNSFRLMRKEGYHSVIYLNINVDGVDVFLDR